MSQPKMKATERKALLRQQMKQEFNDAGCELVEMKAGPQHYTAVRQPGTGFNVAAIYGSRIGASLWIKEKVHDRLRDKYPDEYKSFSDVVDVDLFRRGFAWAIHFKDPIEEAALISLVCKVSLQWGDREEARKEAATAAKLEMLEARKQREAVRRERMSGKRDAWRRRKTEPSSESSLEEVGFTK